MPRGYVLINSAAVRRARRRYVRDAPLLFRRQDEEPHQPDQHVLDHRVVVHDDRHHANLRAQASTFTAVRSRVAAYHSSTAASAMYVVCSNAARLHREGSPLLLSLIHI